MKNQCFMVFLSTFAALGSPVMADLSPEHSRLMEQVAAATQDCVEAEFVGADCDHADALHAQATAAGICWEAESNPYYCSSASTVDASNGFPFDDDAVRLQFNQLPKEERVRMQDVMNGLGYYTAAFDGLYGPSTSRAIRETLQEISEQRSLSIDMSHRDGVKRGLQIILMQTSFR